MSEKSNCPVYTKTWSSSPADPAPDTVPEVAFDSAGTYSVTLTLAEDGSGCCNPGPVPPGIDVSGIILAVVFVVFAAWVFQQLMGESHDKAPV